MNKLNKKLKEPISMNYFKGTISFRYKWTWKLFLKLLAFDGVIAEGKILKLEI